MQHDIPQTNITQQFLVVLHQRKAVGRGCMIICPSKAEPALLPSCSFSSSSRHHQSPACNISDCLLAQISEDGRPVFDELGPSLLQLENARGLSGLCPSGSRQDAYTPRMAAHSGNSRDQGIRTSHGALWCRERLHALECLVALRI